MTDSSLPPENELDRLDPLSLASAAIDGELADDEFAAAEQVLPDRAAAERVAMQQSVDLVRGADLPTPPPGLAAMQIAAAMEHFEAVTPEPIAAPIDLTERRNEKEAAQQRAAAIAEEAKRQQGGRRLQLLARVAGVVLVLGAVGGLISALNGGGEDSDTAASAPEAAIEGDDDRTQSSFVTTEAMEDAEAGDSGSDAAAATAPAAETDDAASDAEAEFAEDSAPLNTSDFPEFVEQREITLVLLPSFTSADEAVLQGQVQLLPPSDSFCAEQQADLARNSGAAGISGVAFVIQDGQPRELVAFEDAEGAFATAVYLDPTQDCIVVA